MTQQGAQDQGTMDAAREQVQEQAQRAAEQARGLASQAGDQARGLVDQRSTQAGEQIGRQADDLRATADQLRRQGKDGPAKVAEQAAERAERLGGYLRDSDADRILSDVERMARENPWAVVAGGIALGFAASRFLKASSRKRYEASTADRPQLPRHTPATTGARDPDVASSFDSGMDTGAPVTAAAGDVAAARAGARAGSA